MDSNKYNESALKQKYNVLIYIYSQQRRTGLLHVLQGKTITTQTIQTRLTGIGSKIEPRGSIVIAIIVINFDKKKQIVEQNDEINRKVYHNNNNHNGNKDINNRISNNNNSKESTTVNQVVLIVTIDQQIIKIECSPVGVAQILPRQI